jgi:hypothetical protein
MTDISKLRMELDELNIKCQQARDNEVRYGLQRSRLEAERAQLLAQMVVMVQQPSALSTPYAITWQTAALVPTNKPTKPRIKPEGLPPVSAMVMTVLDNAEAPGLKPQQIRDRIRAKYWPEAPADRIISAAWKLAKGGKLAYADGYYRRQRNNGAVSSQLQIAEVAGETQRAE